MERTRNSCAGLDCPGLERFLLSSILSRFIYALKDVPAALSARYKNGNKKTITIALPENEKEEIVSEIIFRLFARDQHGAGRSE